MFTHIAATPWRLSIWAVLAGVWVAAPAASQPDVLYSERHTFTISDGRSPEVIEDVEVAVTYVSPRSASETRFSLHEQYFNRLSNFQAAVDGRPVRSRQFSTRRAESADIFLSGGTIQEFQLESPPAPGQRLTFSYRRTYADAAYLPVVYVPNVRDLERFVLVVKHPSDVEVGFDIVAPQGGEAPVESHAAGESSLVFEARPGVQDVPLYALNGFHAAIQMDVRRGDQPLTPTRPEELAQWYGSLLTGVDTSGTRAVRALAATLQRDTPRETVAAIHDHVRQSIRYIADERDVGAFLPRTPDLVMERAYGDCKDRAFLVSALARELGLRVDVVLASTDVMPATAGVSLGLYNHAINAFGTAENRIYFDPTHPYLPFGVLPENDLDGRALRLGEDGVEDLRLVAQDTLPALDVAVDLDLESPGQADAVIVARGEVLGMIREAQARGAATDAVNVLSAIAGEWLYKIRLSHLTLSEDRTDEVVWRGRADLSQFVVASPTRKYLPLTPFRSIPSEARERIADDLPIHVSGRPNVRLALSVAPGPWETEASETRWGGPSAQFHATVQSGEDGTALVYQFRQRTRHFAGDDRTAYLDLADRYLGARREVITFQIPSE